MIVLIGEGGVYTRELRKLIEFMDTPSVCSATPRDWQERIGDARLEAVFVCPDLEDQDARNVIESVGKRDPNIPIVLVSDEGAA